MFNDTATTGIYSYLHTLSLLDALPILPLGRGDKNVLDPGYARSRLLCRRRGATLRKVLREGGHVQNRSDGGGDGRSEEHTSELQSLMRTSYAVFCLQKTNTQLPSHRSQPTINTRTQNHSITHTS